VTRIEWVENHTIYYEEIQEALGRFYQKMVVLTEDAWSVF
jgi:hypothetical protein